MAQVRFKVTARLKVKVRTAQGHTVPVLATYYCCKGQRRARASAPLGVYAGLVLLGIHDRCTPALAAEVSLLAAMLGLSGGGRRRPGPQGRLRWTPKRYGRLPIAMRHGPGWCNRLERTVSEDTCGGAWGGDQQ